MRERKKKKKTCEIKSGFVRPLIISEDLLSKALYVSIYLPHSSWLQDTIRVKPLIIVDFVNSTKELWGSSCYQFIYLFIKSIFLKEEEKRNWYHINY